MNLNAESVIENVIRREWKPFDKQQDFLSVPFSIFEVLYGGAAGGGKSDAVVLMPLLYGFHKKENYKGLILRRNISDLEKEILVRAKKWYPHTGAWYNDRKKAWEWPCGAMEVMGHAENEKDIARYDGIEYHKVSYEEATHFSEFQYRYLTFSRVRSADPFLPAIVRSTTNPGNIGHAFFRKRFVDPDRKGYRIIESRKTGLKRVYIPARLTDNPFLMINDPDYIKRMEEMPEAERRAKLYGDWYTFEGQVFDTFRPLGPFEDEPAHAIHVIEPFEVPEWWPKIAVIDWGYSALTWYGMGAVAPNGQLFVIDEEVFHKQDIAIWATEVGKRIDRFKNVVKVKLDDNAWQNKGEPLTIADQFERFSGFHPEPADKGRGSRVSGKLLVQEWLRWKPRPSRKVASLNFNAQLAEKIYREYGTEQYHKYMRSFEADTIEANIPKLQIFNTCTSLIETIPLCMYNPDNVEDVKEFEGDDPYDGLRYLIRAADSYIAEAAEEYKKVQLIDKVQTQLSNTGNQTSFYRQMEALERGKKKSIGVVRYNSRRFH